MSVTVLLRHTRWPAGASVEPGITRTTAMRWPHSGALGTITRILSEETVLWTTGLFLVQAILKNGQTAGLLLEKDRG
jgi:hypothetical protein